MYAVLCNLLQIRFNGITISADSTIQAHVRSQQNVNIYVATEFRNNYFQFQIMVSLFFRPADFPTFNLPAEELSLLEIYRSLFKAPFQLSTLEGFMSGQTYVGL